jgi:peptide-methionine (R)-S-oxide reductase
MTEPIKKTDAEWRTELTAEQYHVCRQCGTEPPFSGVYWDCHEDGTYRCSCCQSTLFDSASKFESGSGWPSFWQTAQQQAVKLIVDNSHGMQRTEVRCARCDAHLGHVFEDGPQPTGLRYCINSASLLLERK